MHALSDDLQGLNQCSCLLYDGRLQPDRSYMKRTCDSVSQCVSLRLHVPIHVTCNVIADAQRLFGICIRPVTNRFDQAKTISHATTLMLLFHHPNYHTVRRNHEQCMHAIASDLQSQPNALSILPIFLLPKTLLSSV